MEASGTPTPPAEPPQASPLPPPPPPTSAVDDDRASGGWRALGVVLALALAFACAVMVIAMVDIGDTPIEKDCVTPLQGGTCVEYFDGSSAQKTATLVLGWPSGVIAGIAALVALAFAATGRYGRLLLQLTGAAIVLGAASILIGSV
jgi:hypothetical protein